MVTFDDNWLRSHCGHFDPSTVSELNLKGNGLQVLPGLIRSFTSLKYLNLSDNNLSDDELSKICTRYLPLLEDINLSGNKKITTISSMILPMPKSKLVCINLQGTSLINLPSGLDDLEKLNVSDTPLNNSLESLDNVNENVFNYPNLQWLNSEPIFCSDTEKGFKDSFYNQRRLILKHLEMGIPFEPTETEKSAEMKSAELLLEESKRAATDCTLDISAKLKERLGKTRQEINEKLAVLDSLMAEK